MDEGDRRPRVFVSSVVKGFEEYREAARRGIEAAGGEPVLVNEDFPAQPDSPRNACLDAVDSCDIYLAIIGDRGGGQLLLVDWSLKRNTIEPEHAICGLWYSSRT